MSLFAVVLCLCALPFLSVRAQDSGVSVDENGKKEIPTPAEVTKERFENRELRRKAQDGTLGELDDLSKVNPAYLEEMDRIYGVCSTSSLYSTYYDCKCQAVKFLDQRIKLGPTLPSENIMMDVNKECANIPGLAGYAYDICTKNLSLLNYKDKDFAPFCECFANKFAKTYAKNPKLSSRNVQVLQRNAYRECGFSDLRN